MKMAFVKAKDVWDMRDYWLSRAIRICGSQQELARRMRIKREKVSYILNRAKYISLEDALLVDDATGGEVHFSNLVEFLNPKIRKKLEEILKESKKSKISERVIAAMAFENEMNERRGRPKANLEIRRNFDELKGRTDEAAARKYGFNCKDTYRQAKQVIQQGIPELIFTMDTEYIPISLAAKLAVLPSNEQKKILQCSNSKKEIIAKLKQISQKSEKADFSLNKAELDTFLLNSLQIYLYLSHHLERNH